MIGLEVTAELRSDTCNRLPLRRFTDPQDHDASLSHEREAELRCDRWLGQSLGESDTVRLELVLLGAPPDDAGVREIERAAFEEVALATVGFEQRERVLGERGREWKTGRPAARSHVDDRANSAFEQRHGAQCVVEESAACDFGIGDPGHAGSRDHLLEPALEERRRHVSRRAGAG